MRAAFVALSVGAALVAASPSWSTTPSSSTSTAPSSTAPTSTSTAPSSMAPSSTGEAPGTWTFAGVPRLTLNSDEGIGLGVRGVLYWHRFETKPYKTAISFQVWATTRLVQHHFVRVDAIDAFRLPLRLEAEAGFFSTLTMPYCGDPPSDDCVDGDDTRLRSLEPYVMTNARFLLWRGPWLKRGARGLKLEAFVSWRGTGYIPGTLFDDDGDGAPDLFPYPGSRYAADHPNGEPGFASVIQGGVAVDTRDNEPNPTSGFFVEASVRDAQPTWGSSYAFAGANFTGRLYAPVVDGVVVAERVVVDGVIGDAPWRERVRIGGLTDYAGIGGQDLGRGIRLARYPGRVRAMLQHELRATPLVVDVLGHEVAFPVAAFVDSGVAVFDDDSAAPRLLVGGGLSFRLVWDRTFVMRLDLALSPEEPGRLSAYSAPNHPF